MSTVNPFQPAVKAQIKARVAFAGPTGSGKTWTALAWATVLAGPDGAKRRDDGLAKIAFIDTERRSASLYAPHFTFDVVNFNPPYKVPKLLESLHQAEAAGYSVAVVDSWSHFWEGEGGVLDEVDAAAARSFGGNSFGGWKVGTPMQRGMVDTILALDMHVIVCMRSKMEWALVEYTDSKNNKRSKPEKIGMAPVQRSGVEYEFQVVGDMDLDHKIVISKSRCDVLADMIIQPHREREAAATFLEWLNAGEPLADHEAVMALIALLNEIPDRDERKVSKELFVDAFGTPDTLLGSQLEEAAAWVAERLAPPAPPEPQDDVALQLDGGAGEQAPRAKAR